MSAGVKAVSRSAAHTFSKPHEARITLLAGQDVEGDAHAGATVKHLSRILKFGNAPNLRQVHLIHEELFEELRAAGFALSPGQMGENVTTRGVDLLKLPKGARLQLGEAAVIEITGLRNPCRQLNKLQPGLMAATLARATWPEIWSARPASWPSCWRAARSRTATRSVSNCRK